MGYAPTQAGTPPTLYQTTTVTGYKTTPLTISFSKPFTANSYVVVMGTGGCANKYPCGQSSLSSPPSFTKIIAQGRHSYVAITDLF